MMMKGRRGKREGRRECVGDEAKWGAELFT
jgi:hypothetical protein